MGVIGIIKGLFSGGKKLLGDAEELELGLYRTFFSIEDDAKAFVKNLEAFKNFDFDPKWKTRVIVVPRAIQSFEDLFGVLRDDLVPKFKTLIEEIEAFANLVTGNVGGGTGGDEPGGGLAHFAGRIADISIGLANIQKAFHSALDIEGTLIDIKNRVEALDDLFLPQGSSKTVVDISYRKRNAG
jgi:hypothetical protein